MLENEYINDNNNLMENFKIVQDELEIAQKNYQFATSNEAIDYYIYQIKAYQSKFDNLLKQLKGSNMVNQNS